MKPHPYLALAAHLEELSANRPASNQPWSSVAPLCLATLAVVPRATEKQLLRLEKAFLAAKGSCSGMEEVWRAWVQQHDPWSRRPEEDRWENHGWELATVFCLQPSAPILEALLACPTAPSAQAIETGYHARHCFDENAASQALLGRAWAVPLSLLGCLVSTSAWNTNGPDREKATRRLLEAVDVLLAHGVDINAPVTADGRRALGLANDPALVQGLLERGADPFAPDARGVPAVATFWEGPAMIGSDRAEALVKFWNEQPGITWEVNGWKAWLDGAVEKVLESAFRGASAVVRKPNAEAMAQLFRKGVWMGGEVAAVTLQRGPLLAQQLVLASRLSKKPVPATLAPVAWWPSASARVKDAHWLLMAQGLSLQSEDTPVVPAALSRRVQEELVGASGRQEALRLLKQELTGPPADAMAMAQAWCLVVALRQTVGREDFFDQWWPAVARESLTFCKHAQSEDLDEAFRYWARQENKGLVSAFKTEMDGRIRACDPSKWALEELFLMATLTSAPLFRRIAMEQLDQRSPWNAAVDEALEGVIRLAPQSWAPVGLKEVLSQRRLDRELAEQPAQPRPRF